MKKNKKNENKGWLYPNEYPPPRDKVLRELLQYIRESKFVGKMNLPIDHHLVSYYLQIWWTEGLSRSHRQ